MLWIIAQTALPPGALQFLRLLHTGYHCGACRTVWVLASATALAGGVHIGMEMFYQTTEPRNAAEISFRMNVMDNRTTGTIIQNAWHDPEQPCHSCPPSPPFDFECIVDPVAAPPFIEECCVVDQRPSHQRMNLFVVPKVPAGFHRHLLQGKLNICRWIQKDLHRVNRNHLINAILPLSYQGLLPCRCRIHGWGCINRKTPRDTAAPLVTLY